MKRRPSADAELRSFLDCLANGAGAYRRDPDGRPLLEVDVRRWGVLATSPSEVVLFQPLRADETLVRDMLSVRLQDMFGKETFDGFLRDEGDDRFAEVVSAVAAALDAPVHKWFADARGGDMLATGRHLKLVWSRP